MKQLIEQEGTTHLFQLHYATESTKENHAYILDTIMESGPRLLIPPQQNESANLADEPQETHRLLTGPETDTQKGTESLPTVEKTSYADDHTDPLTKHELLQALVPVTVQRTGTNIQRVPESAAIPDKPPGTPPVQDMLQASTPVTVERTETFA